MPIQYFLKESIVNKYFKVYSDSALLPFSVFVASYVIPLFFCAKYLPNANLFLMTLPLGLLSFLGMVAATIVNFTNRRWGRGAVNLGFVLLVLLVFLMSFFASAYWR